VVDPGSDRQIVVTLRHGQLRSIGQIRRVIWARLLKMVLRWEIWVPVDQDDRDTHLVIYLVGSLLWEADQREEADQQDAGVLDVGVDEMTPEEVRDLVPNLRAGEKLLGQRKGRSWHSTREARGLRCAHVGTARSLGI
jgi:hypothetical protein